ncbi:unnamed protein product [Protopolystoma xenopodis]|uniref:TAFII28-like protein domain-containing protein n=1 Tax=Protopolystoma xenopodis TaxID=117903 RepID=A0A3S5BBV9_9PLAT|nr:unnamed protein product [Protopolystoma xenopodis]
MTLSTSCSATFAVPASVDSGLGSINAKIVPHRTTPTSTTIHQISHTSVDPADKAVTFALPKDGRLTAVIQDSQTLSRSTVEPVAIRTRRAHENGERREEGDDAREHLDEEEDEEEEGEGDDEEMEEEEDDAEEEVEEDAEEEEEDDDDEEEEEEEDRSTILGDDDTESVVSRVAARATSTRGETGLADLDIEGSEAKKTEDRKLMALLAHFSDEQLSRFELYRRSYFPKATVRRVSWPSNAMILFHYFSLNP